MAWKKLSYWGEMQRHAFSNRFRHLVKLRQEGAQPLAQFADVLWLVEEVVAPAPTVTTYGIEVHGG